MAQHDQTTTRACQGDVESAPVIQKSDAVLGIAAHCGKNNNFFFTALVERSESDFNDDENSPEIHRHSRH